MKRMIPIALILAAMLCYGTALQADTTITYQGRLDSGGQPYTGTVGMVFELYDQESGGTQQGPTLNQSVQVSGGLFQAELVLINEYKRRQSAPGPRITRKTFGRDRRYPITSGWRDSGVAVTPEQIVSGYPNRLTGSTNPLYCG